MTNNKTPMEAEQKLKEAADKYAIDNFGSAPHGLAAIGFFMAGAKSEAARDYWQQQNRVDVDELREEFYNYFMKGISGQNTAKLKYGVSKKDLFDLFLPHLQQPQGDGWISVEEQKPINDTQVLIWPHHQNSPSAFYGNRISDKPTFYLYGATIHTVKYWKQLPQPPKQKEGKGE